MGSGSWSISLIKEWSRSLIKCLRLIVVKSRLRFWFLEMDAKKSKKGVGRNWEKVRTLSWKSEKFGLNWDQQNACEHKNRGWAKIKKFARDLEKPLKSKTPQILILKKSPTFKKYIKHPIFDTAPLNLRSRSRIRLLHHTQKST